MHQTAEQVLTDVLLKYGSSACDTPQMLETFLRKHGRACPKEVNILSAALRCGIVNHLRSDKNIDPASLAKLLMLEARISQPEAEWAVAAWSAGIANAPAKVSTPRAARPSAPSSAGSFVRAVVVFFVVAVTGAIALHIFHQ